MGTNLELNNIILKNLQKITEGHHSRIDNKKPEWKIMNSTNSKKLITGFFHFISFI